MPHRPRKKYPIPLSLMLEATSTLYCCCNVSKDIKLKYIIFFPVSLKLHETLSARPSVPGYVNMQPRSRPAVGFSYNTFISSAKIYLDIPASWPFLIVALSVFTACDGISEEYFELEEQPSFWIQVPNDFPLR